MTKTRVAWVVACGLLLLSGCNKGEFREFTSEEDQFKVLMPGSPRESSQMVLGMTLKTYMVEDLESAFGVAVATLPSTVSRGSDADVEARLSGARDGMVKNVNGKLTRSARIKLNNRYPGREIEADVPDKKGILRARVYLVNQRFYQILVIGKENVVNSADATKFLDSLVVNP